jgi:hypothetical protein
MSSRKALLIAAILAGSATGVLAQTSTPPPAAKGTPTQPAQGMPMGPGASGAMPMMGGQRTGGMPMMGMMQMVMGQGMAGHVEGRIAFLNTELKITDAQMPLWNAVADAIRAAPKDMAQMQCMSSMQSTMQQQSITLPEKLAAREKTMTAHLEAFRKFKAAVEPLYPALSDEQKKTADQLLLGPMGMMGMGMM